MSMGKKGHVHNYLSSIQKELVLGKTTEHSYRPALKTLIEKFSDKILAINEPKKIGCGAPDFLITSSKCPVGYIETKDVGNPLDLVENSEQVRRYLNGISNFVLTNYVEFRWYNGGQKRLTSRIANVDSNGKLVTVNTDMENLLNLINNFITFGSNKITNAKELAIRMAQYARLIRDVILDILTEEKENNLAQLYQQMEGFRQVLLREITNDQLADMYAQTICYGLFTARYNLKTKEELLRTNAAYAVPKTNPFLRNMFSQIVGPNLDDRVAWIVDDLVEVLNFVDMHSLLRTSNSIFSDDPVFHFYETFLTSYDTTLRELRGVYYTPKSVVSYIVRSVDQILQKDFGLAKGLTDSTKIKVTSENQDSLVHKVQILDPAVGTGTFLHEIIDKIYKDFKSNQGLWSGYVSKHLLPRLYGFELLMAPYTVTHMKLGFKLTATGYDFRSNERLRVYLTNTLEDAHETISQPLFAHWLSQEANAANHVKLDVPVMVIVGNPPYFGKSINNSEWILSLIDDYYYVDNMPLSERNTKWLRDDYVKFIRFSQWRIDRTGSGVLAFVTNHGYLDNPTFRGMRQHLMKSFSEIYVLDIHGNSNKGERTDEGKVDENVFDIRQGVAIGIFIKKEHQKESCAKVYHADVWGKREKKYEILNSTDIQRTDWKELKPSSPFYLFVPTDDKYKFEYERGVKVTDIFSINSVGMVTARDKLTICWSSDEIWKKVNDFFSLSESDIRNKYNIGRDSQDWRVALAKKDIIKSGPSKEFIRKIHYRPFDIRYTYYTGKSKGFICRPRREVMQHMLSGENIALITSRLTKGEDFKHVQVVDTISEVICMSPKTSNNGYVFPLYIHQEDGIQTSMMDVSSHNIKIDIITEIRKLYNLKFVPRGHEDLTSTFGPENIFYYIYAVLQSPSYQKRYVDHLRVDFPRITFTKNKNLFKLLGQYGKELVSIHLFKSQIPIITRFPISGSNMVQNFKFDNKNGRVYINKDQYVEGVDDEVWNFQIGGYNVCRKWLKDRKKQNLSYDQVMHYQRIISVISLNIKISKDIDLAIENHGGWPI
jgi:predicted helicase